MSSNRFRSLCLATMCLATACSVPRWYDYGFSPSPNEIEVPSPGDSNADLRVLVTILGIARGADKQPDRVEVRMRMENMGATAAQLVPDSFSLYSADLQLFGPPIVVPSEPPPVPSGGSATFDIAFPLPDGRGPDDMNLRGLNMRWTVMFGDRRVTTGATFARTDWRAPYDDYPRVHVGVGFGTTIH